MIRIFEENKWLSLMTTILIAIGIFIISSVSSFSNISGSGSLSSVYYHFFAFFFLSLFFFFYLYGKVGVKGYFFSVVLLFIYAALDELHQYFVPGRFCSGFDILTDSLGVIFAGLIYYLYLKVRS